jgi:hypothetical protein
MVVTHGTEYRKRIICEYLRAKSIQFTIKKIDIAPFKYEIQYFFPDQEDNGKKKAFEAFIKDNNVPHEWGVWDDSDEEDKRGQKKKNS